MKASELKRLTCQGLQELAFALEDGHSESLKAYLTMLARFHRYSAGNVLLIGLQHPGATKVAGYRTWQRLGRKVRQGQTAIRILAPIVHRKRTEGDDEEEKTENVLAFKPACVFDVGQTEGKALPELSGAEGDPGQYVERLEALIAGRGILLKRTAAIGSALGASAGGQIYLREGLAPAESFSTLVHELAHEMLHHHQQPDADKTVRETEAEAVAFVVCEAIGLQAREASSDYIQLYDGNKETLLASLGRIRQTAVEIIEGIQERGKDEANHAEQPAETVQAAAA